MIVHLNGRLVPRDQALISPFDRAFLFGDAVYEGLRAFQGRVVAFDRHLRRLRDGLREARIRFDPNVLVPATCQLLEVNRMPDAFVYWQISRGVPGPGEPPRTRVPPAAMTPTVFGYCTPQPPIEHYVDVPTTTAATVRDTRWLRGRLKSTSLLGNILGALDAVEAGAADAILVRDGLVAEGAATNVVVAVPVSGGDTEIATPALDSVPILPGITRELLLEAVHDLVARPVRVDELHRAREIMLVGTTAMVTAVTTLDGRPVGDGCAGPVARRLLAALVRLIRRELRLEEQSAALTEHPPAPPRPMEPRV